MKKIVFPEVCDERVVKAVLTLAEERVCTPVVFGNELSKHKNLEVLPEVDDMISAGSSLVSTGGADAIIAGATTKTADVFKIYRKYIGVADGVSRVSSCFVMERGRERFIFADCAINILPDTTTLAETAHLASVFATKVGLSPRTVFLSFATEDSANHELVDKIKEAVVETKKRWPDMVCDGPLQFDAAAVPGVAQQKKVQGVIKGDANVFIFPDLNSANIGYKIAQRWGGFSATGPFFQVLTNRPMICPVVVRVKIL